MRLALDKQAALTAEQLRQMADYDPQTGRFTRRHSGTGFAKGAAFANTKTPAGYLKGLIRGRVYLAHRLAWLHYFGEWPKGFLDHIDCNRANNAICNLREATQAQNMANRRAQGQRPLKGITRHSRGRWQAQIRHQGRNIFIGLFDTAEEAHAAYVAMAATLKGEFARAA